MSGTAVAIDGDRLWQSVVEIGEIGDTGDGAMMRVTGSEADRRARDRVVSWFEAAGLTVDIDPVGNIVARRDGQTDRPAVLTGSHIDTVPQGGKFDGTAGVLTALEVVRAWNDAGIETDRPLEIVVFTEEEGTRFGTPLLGSRVAAGHLSTEDALSIEDDDGQSVAAVLDDIGYHGSAEFDAGQREAFVELHVEQGPRLESSGHDVGIVDHITGIAHARVTITGEANHAGTTTMELRRDAFTGGAEFALALEDEARKRARDTDAVGTVGKIDASPNGTNVVPGAVVLGVDIRDTDEPTRQALVEYARERGGRIADDRDLGFEWEDRLDIPATPMSDHVVTTLSDACDASEASCTRMASGAGHDAMNVADVTPTGMVFVPSEDGISHSPDEYTAPDELATGARVLERSLRSLTEA